METQTQDTRIYADTTLINKVKAAYPETTRMTNTGLVHWALTKMLQEAQP